MTQPETPAVPTLPTHITRAQLLAACEALGLDAAVTAGFNLTIMVGLTSVLVIQYELNEQGHKFIVGETAAMNTFRIPVAEPVNADA